MGKYKKDDSVKIEVVNETTKESEWMWLLVESSDDKQRIVFGTLDSEPIVNTDMRLGMKLAVSYDHIREHLPASTFKQQ
jgi:hypothetical protein